MRKELLSILGLIVGIIFLFSCEKETIFPDYSKYRIKNIYSKSQADDSRFSYRYEYIYAKNSKIDSINMRDEFGDLHSCKKFHYDHNRLSTIEYPNINYGGIFGKDSLIYNENNLISKVLVVNDNNILITSIIFEYDDKGRIIKRLCIEKPNEYYSYTEEYIYDSKNNIVQKDRYDFNYDSSKLEYSFTELFKYDRWVNPYFTGGFIGSYSEWPLSPNNVVERIDQKPGLEDKSWTFYYEYLQDGYPIKTNSTLQPLDLYTEFEYEKD